MRVPVEVLKQRMQVFQYQTGITAAARGLYASEGILGFYRGFQATLQREIPFACIQFPVYELLKRKWQQSIGIEELKPWKAAICGSIAGGVAAALTTPLDVIKTRTILSRKEELKQYQSPWQAMSKLWREGGVKKLFSGVTPRVLWISLGGFIFFGAYEKAKKLLQRVHS